MKNDKKPLVMSNYDNDGLFFGRLSLLECRLSFMYCKKCYRKVDLTWARCHCCGNPINQENVTNDENMIKKL